MGTTTEPGYVAEARTRKATDIAVLCHSWGWTADDVAHLDVPARHRVERVAGVGRRSDLTWLAVLNLLAGSVRTRCPWCGHGDPEGDPGPAKDFGHPGPCST